MKVGGLKSGVVSLFSALTASLCCLLPLAVVLMGFGSGAFMAVTMQYRSIFIPLGVLGISLGYLLYFRERSRCRRQACQMTWGKLNLALLLVATVVVAVAIFLDQSPALSSKLLMSTMK